MSFPGLIQMENYDVGGEGLAYHDVDFVNEGGLYREDGVDIVGIDCNTEGTNCTGGFCYRLYKYR